MRRSVNTAVQHELWLVAHSVLHYKKIDTLFLRLHLLIHKIFHPLTKQPSQTEFKDTRSYSIIVLRGIVKKQEDATYVCRLASDL